MCAICGCSDHEGVTLSLDAHEHVHADGTRHSHGHGEAHAHVHADEHGRSYTLRHPLETGQAHVIGGGLHERHHDHAPVVADGDSHTVALEAQILGKNQLIAERNRGWLAGRGILALNLVSSPGAGKTTLLERTINDMKDKRGVSVIEGDQATSNDAERIRATGVPALQINTGAGCHLEADMIERALAILKPEPRSVLLVENVGNLVCPALFDLGERAKVVIFSVTEGEDKPLKYPHMFRAAAAMILSKTDLLPHVRFDAARAIANAMAVNPRLKVFEVSAYSGAGLAQWYAWLEEELAACGV